jgi:D-serine deaminase-like pyridoxal phosphate-dependent protein
MRLDLPDVAVPTLLLDEVRVRRNIARMADKAAASGVCLRPHFKTHQSAVIGGWFREAGVTAITVSSLEMAAYFIRQGWRDVTVAFPYNPRQRPLLSQLVGRAELGLLADSGAAIAALAAAAGPLSLPLKVWLKIDTGYGRVGIPWHRPGSVRELARAVAVSPGLRLAGLLTHAGHSYGAGSRAEIAAIHAESLARLQGLRESLGRIPPEAVAAGGAAEPPAGGGLAISIGDTPTASVVEDLSGCDEIRPGNFVFHDLMQEALTACGPDDLAVALACPVVGVYPARGEIALQGGAVHLSRESLPGEGGRPIYGCLASLAGESSDEAVDGVPRGNAPGPPVTLGRPLRRAPVVALSQEHGIIRLPPELMADLEPGDLVAVFPVHSCLTCDLHGGYRTLDGRWIARRQCGRDPVLGDPSMEGSPLRGP